MPKRKRLLTSLGLFLGRQPEANFGRFRFGRTRTNGLGRFFRGHLGPFDFGSDAVSVCAIAKCRLQTVGFLVTVAYPRSILFGLCSRRAHLVAIVTVTHERLSTTICVVRKRIYVTSGIRKGSFPGCLSGIRGYGAAGAHAGGGVGGVVRQRFSGRVGAPPSAVCAVTWRSDWLRRLFRGRRAAGIVGANCLGLGLLVSVGAIRGVGAGGQRLQTAGHRGLCEMEKKSVCQGQRAAMIVCLPLVIQHYRPKDMLRRRLMLLRK